MQRLGDDRLPRMKCVGAALGRSLRGVASGCRLWCRSCGQDGQKIFHGAIPRQLHLRCQNFGAGWPDVPDRRRKHDEERLADNRGSKRRLRKPLLDPAIAKVWRAEKPFWRDRPAKQSYNAGDEFFSPANPCNCKPWETRLGFRVVAGSQTPSPLRVTGGAHLNHPVRIIRLQPLYRPGNAKEWLAVHRAICNDKLPIRAPG